MTFHVWPGQLQIEALLFGVARRLLSAGACEVHVDAVPWRNPKRMEILRQLEGIPKLLRRSHATHSAAVPNPIDVFVWSAPISTGAMTVLHD